MEKKLVFISHIHEEREIANEFKKLIEDSFLGMIDVFVSSNEQNIEMGQRWLDNITGALKQASVEILLCSPKSVERPWINFEAGAGWIKDIPVIPLCHSGMSPSQLPVPLNMLQAAKASETSSLKLVFPVLANAIGSATPNVDFTNFVESVRKFEIKYTFWDDCNSYFRKLNQFHGGMIEILKNNSIIDIELQEIDIRFIEDLMQFFTPNKILGFKRKGDVKMTTSGTFYGCEIIPLENLQSVLNDENLDYK